MRVIENLFREAAMYLKARGWIQQPSFARATLFHHPEFGTHDLFAACYIQRKAEKIRRRRWWAARIRPAVYSILSGGFFLFAFYKFLTWELMEILL